MHVISVRVATNRRATCVVVREEQHNSISIIFGEVNCGLNGLVKSQEIGYGILESLAWSAQST
jgi:hypothetical protein